MVKWKLGLCTVLWTAMYIYPAISSPLLRQRRVLNEPGDIVEGGRGPIIPSNKRQQIIYLLNNNNTTKRDNQPEKNIMSNMEKYGKELTEDGRVVTMTKLPQKVDSFAFYGPSEELHGRGFKEVAVNKGDGPPKLVGSKSLSHGTGKDKFTGLTSSVQQGTVGKPAAMMKPQQEVTNAAPSNTLNTARVGGVNNLTPQAPKASQGVQKSVIAGGSVSTPSGATSSQMVSQSAEEQSSKSRVKNSDIRIGRLPDGEVMLPHRRIEPNIFSISQSDISSSSRFSPEEIRGDPEDHSTVLIPGDDPPSRGYANPGRGYDRWDAPPRRRYHRRYHHRYHHRRPVVLNGRPDMYYMPLYSGHAQLEMIPFTPGEGMPEETTGRAPALPGFPTPGDRRGVLLQPLVQVPAVQPQQGIPPIPVSDRFNLPFEQPDPRPALLADLPSSPSQPMYAPALPVVPDYLHSQEMPREEQSAFETELQQQRQLEEDQLQRQREMQQREFASAQSQESHMPLATNWVDEPGRARSSVDEVPRPEPILQDRFADDRERYFAERYYNERPDNFDRVERFNKFKDDYDEGDERGYPHLARYHDPREEEPIAAFPREPEEGLSREPEVGLPREPEVGLPREPEVGLPREPELGIPMEPEEDYRAHGQPEVEPYEEENANARSNPPDYPPKPDENEDEDDDDEESESDDSQAALQDSREEPLEQEGDKPEPQPEIEPPQPQPGFESREPGYEPKVQKVSPFEGMMQNPSGVSNEDDEAPSVIRIPSRPHPMFSLPSSRYHEPLMANTLERGQLLGDFSPMRPKVLPHLPFYPRPREDQPDMSVSEMSESAARFKERMNMEMEAGSMPVLTSKDTIPGKTSLDDLKNTIIRLNGKPLELGSELRSRIIHGRIIRGKGKLITSKGPINIKVSHTKGPRKMKIIDIISPQQFHVSDARSRIGRLGKGKGRRKYMQRKGYSGAATNNVHKRKHAKKAKVDSLDRVASMLAETLLRKDGKNARTLQADLEKLKS